MLEFEYPIISQFHGDHAHVVRLFHERFPNAPIPEIGPAAWSIRYSDPFFDNQDAWNEMELCNQSSRFRLTEDRDFIINGPGLPFERLYFQARAQLSYATDELLREGLRSTASRSFGAQDGRDPALNHPPIPPHPTPSFCALPSICSFRQRRRWPGGRHSPSPGPSSGPAAVPPGLIRPGPTLRSRRSAPTGPAKGSPGLELQI